MEEVSVNSGYTKNYNPLITLRKVSNMEYVYFSWIGYRKLRQDETLAKTDVVIKGETRVLLRNKTSTLWSVTGAYGNNAQSQNLNTADEFYSNQQLMGIAWSELSGSSYTNKLIKSTATSTIYTLNTTGKDIQVNNSTNLSDMFVNSFQSASLPYSFNLSQNFASLGKETSVTAFNGREGVIGRDGGEFYFALGDISVNGVNICFPSIPDTIDISNISDLNSYLISEPFTADDNSSLVYGVQYGITDTLLCINALKDGREINFRVELSDAVTNEVIGIFDNVTFNENNVIQYENIGYQVDLTGAGSRLLRL